MSEHLAKRTLVKSPPELWAEVSDPGSLAARLAALGEITITGTEPETTVAWEGENVSGTVTLDASGWGTKVILEATLETPPETEAPAPVEVPAPEAEAPAPVEAPAAPPAGPEPAPRPGFFARLFGSGPQEAPEPEPQAPAHPGPEPVKPPEVEPQVTAETGGEEPDADEAAGRLDGAAVDAALEAALDAMGAAHHRPFSRS